MNQKKKPTHKHFRIQSRLMLILLASFVISWFIPKQIRFKYDFEKGKPWKYENLLAPFDFGILKSDAELAKEKQQIIQRSTPYYKQDPAIGESVYTRFKADFSLRYPLLQADSGDGINQADSTIYIHAGLKALSQVYEKGILQADTIVSSMKKTDRLYVLKGTEALSVSPQNLLNLQRASTAIRKTLETERTRHPNLNVGFLFNLCVSELQPDIFYDRVLSENSLSEAIEQIAPMRGKINKGEKIIYKGEIVNNEKNEILISLKNEFEHYTASYKPYVLWGGYFILVTLVLALYTLFLLVFAIDLFKSMRKLGFSLLLVTGFLLLTLLSEKNGLPTMYILPFCIVPIVQRNFFGTWAALMTHITVVLLASLLVPNAGGFIFLHLIAGLVAIYANLNAQYWSQFFVASSLIMVTYLATYMGMSMIQEGNLTSINWVNFGWLALNAFFTLMAYPLTLVFERLFGIVSDITLRELADLNKPLLRELSIKAQGTFQHSLQVANLAESAASQVGANPLITRVGCLYHDIGKMRHPAFFTENQSADLNPHDKLSPVESAEIIIGHVSQGTEIARAHNLPEIIVEFIRTHHGTTRVEFFYNKYLEQHPGKDPESIAARFTYPGPKPFSRETGIAMLADSVEAASRSLLNPSVTDMDKLVDGIVKYKIEAGQLNGTDLTFKDINVIKRIFKTMLKSIYHVRPKYPQQKDSSGDSQTGKSDPLAKDRFDQKPTTQTK